MALCRDYLTTTTNCLLSLTNFFLEAEEVAIVSPASNVVLDNREPKTKKFFNHFFITEYEPSLPRIIVSSTFNRKMLLSISIVIAEFG